MSVKCATKKLLGETTLVQERHVVQLSIIHCADMPLKREKLSAADVKQIRQRIEVARKYWEKTWKTKDLMFARLYRGDLTGRGSTMIDLPQPLADNVQLNYLKRLVELKVAGLAAERPTFRFRPRGGGRMPSRVRESMARVWEAYIPYLWRE